MRFELEQLIDSVPAGDELTELLIAGVRKANNLAAHEFIAGVRQNDLTVLSEGIGSMMVVTASNLIMTRAGDPNLDDFAYAIEQLVTVVRKYVDDSYRFKELGDARVSSVMMEVIMRGIAASLGLPYQDIFTEAAGALKEGREPDMQSVIGGRAA